MRDWWGTRVLRAWTIEVGKIERGMLRAVAPVTHCDPRVVGYFRIPLSQNIQSEAAIQTPPASLMKSGLGLNRDPYSAR